VTAIKPIAPKFRLKRVLSSAIIAAAFGVTTPAMAQSNVTGAIHGSAPSATGKVTVEGLGNGIRTTVSPDASGRFRISSLQPGTYKVIYSSEGAADRVEEVVVSIGSSTSVTFGSVDEGVELDTLTVTSAAIAPIDIQQTESGLTISTTQLEKMPVPRNLQSVALLAPGTVKGDTAFGSNAVSFGGASVAENAFYFNGFNITNFRDGLGFNYIPYEFFDNFQVKTGGYGVEFGRSLGGVVNSTSKHGSDTFSAGINMFWAPASLREKNPSVDYPDGSPYFYNENDSASSYEGNVYASGALVPGHLYVYGLVSYLDTSTKSTGAAGSPFSATDEEESTPFYGAKIDYVINERNTLELTYLRNERTTDRSVSDFDPVAETEGESLSGVRLDTGGDTYVGRFTSRLTDTLTVSALAGRSEQVDDTVYTPTSCNYAVNSETGELYGCATASLNDTNEDSRDAYRLDLEYSISTHLIRAGVDYERLEVGNNDYYTGTGYTYRYYPSRNSDGSGTYALETRRYVNTGTVKTSTAALYVEDTWAITDRLSVTAGIRNETFENKGVTGETFFKVDDQWAPRFAIAYDVLGEGRSSLYGSWGRYYLPVATNTNIRLGGAELYEYTRYATYGGINADGTPTSVGDVVATGYYNGSNGETRDPRQLVDQEGIKPMYQDEYSIGFKMSVAPKWNADIRFLRRELKTSLEDECLDGYVADASCALVNPGQDITIYTHYQDTDGDGLYFEDPTDDLHAVTLENSELGFPKAKRVYNAVDVSLERVFDKKWYFKATYTWSQSYGNTEGYVNSDNGQADPGITIAFDYPGLTDYSYGFLPNDRRHKIKLFGSYQFTEEFGAGANLAVYSGRPQNCFGNYPDADAENHGDYSYYYGAASFYCGGEPSPRGSAGRTPWSYQLDLSATYRPYQVKNLALGVDVYNVLNGDKETQVDEYGEFDGSYEPAPSYGLPTAFQTPRYVQFSLKYGF
jgi:outer membrane receptor protein involved in Fe transport